MGLFYACTYYSHTCIFWQSITIDLHISIMEYFMAFKFLYYRLPRIYYCGLLYNIILFRTVLFSFIAMLVFHQCYVSFYFLCFGFPCDYLFFAVVGLRRRNRFQFKVVLTPEQLSMNCNCHLATNRRFICCGFPFYCCVFICKGIC